MRILLIPGAYCSTEVCESLSSHLADAFKEQFQDSHFFTEHCLYLPWEGGVLRNFADRIVRKFDDGGEETVLVGYSMGGNIATAIVSRFEKTTIRAVVTVCSPHTYLGEFFSRICGSQLKGIKAPVVSFASSFDEVVPWGAAYPEAVRHEVIYCDHLTGFYMDRGPAERIAQVAAEVLFS